MAPRFCRRQLDPYRSWRCWSTDRQPRLLAYSAGILPADVRQKMEATILQRSDFQEALQGRAGYGVVNSHVSNKACMLLSQPVYPERPAASGERARRQQDGPAQSERAARQQPRHRSGPPGCW